MPAPSDQKTEADAIAAIARDTVPALEIVCLQPFPAAVVAHQAGKRRDLESLERFLARPVRKRAKIELEDHPSFIDYVQRHKEPGTMIFADVGAQGGSFTAVIDYHHEGVKGEPRFGEHLCIYTAQFTPEWQRWTQGSGVPKTQAAMALFIEDNLYDIIDPEAAAMLELVKTLEATQGSRFKSVIRLENGDRQLGYEKTTTAQAGAKGDMQVPDKFKLRFAVFVNGPVYDVECRFRYRIEEGVLTMAYEIVRPHKIVELALADALVAIKQTTQLPVLQGACSIPKA